MIALFQNIRARASINQLNSNSRKLFSNFSFKKKYILLSKTRFNFYRVVFLNFKQRRRLKRLYWLKRLRRFIALKKYPYNRAVYHKRGPYLHQRRVVKSLKFQKFIQRRARFKRFYLLKDLHKNRFFKLPNLLPSIRRRYLYPLNVTTVSPLSTKFYLKLESLDILMVNSVITLFVTNLQQTYSLFFFIRLHLSRIFLKYSVFRTSLIKKYIKYPALAVSKSVVLFKTKRYIPSTVVNYGIFTTSKDKFTELMPSVGLTSKLLKYLPYFQINKKGLVLFSKTNFCRVEFSKTKGPVNYNFFNVPLYTFHTTGDAANAKASFIFKLKRYKRLLEAPLLTPRYSSKLKNNFLNYIKTSSRTQSLLNKLVSLTARHFDYKKYINSIYTINRNFAVSNLVNPGLITNLTTLQVSNVKVNPLFDKNTGFFYTKFRRKFRLMALGLSKNNEFKFIGSLISSRCPESYINSLVSPLINTLFNLKYYMYVNSKPVNKLSILERISLSHSIQVIRRTGSHFSLILVIQEMIEMVYLTAKFRDFSFIMPYIQRLISKLIIWHHKKFFNFLFSMYKEHIFPIFKLFGIHGIYIKLSGKISVGGDSRKRRRIALLGKTTSSYSHVNTNVTNGLWNTKTGALGIKVFIFSI